MAPRVRGLTCEPRTLTICASSTVTVKLHVSAQSRGQTLGEVCLMCLFSYTHGLTSHAAGVLGWPMWRIAHTVSCTSVLYLEEWLYRRTNFFKYNGAI